MRPTESGAREISARRLGHLARKTQPTWLTKGSVPLTEHYSIIQPEIPVPGHPMGGKNKPFLDTLANADIVAEQGVALTVQPGSQG